MTTTGGGPTGASSAKSTGGGPTGANSANSAPAQTGAKSPAGNGGTIPRPSDGKGKGGNYPNNKRKGRHGDHDDAKRSRDAFTDLPFLRDGTLQYVDKHKVTHKYMGPDMPDVALLTDEPDTRNWRTTYKSRAAESQMAFVEATEEGLEALKQTALALAENSDAKSMLVYFVPQTESLHRRKKAILNKVKPGKVKPGEPANASAGANTAANVKLEYDDLGAMANDVNRNFPREPPRPQNRQLGGNRGGYEPGQAGPRAVIPAPPLPRRPAAPKVQAHSLPDRAEAEIRKEAKDTSGQEKEKAVVDKFAAMRAKKAAWVAQHKPPPSAEGG